MTQSNLRPGEQSRWFTPHLTPEQKKKLAKAKNKAYQQRHSIKGLKDP